MYIVAAFDVLYCRCGPSKILVLFVGVVPMINLDPFCSMYFVPVGVSKDVRVSKC